MVDDFVGAICLTFNLVLVIPASGDIPLQNSIPLENGKLCVPANLLLGLAVNLINRHLYRPFIVLHLVVVATVGGNSNRLVATQSAGRGIEAVRNGDFIVAKRNICKLCPRRGDGSIYHTLCFVFQLVDTTMKINILLCDDDKDFLQRLTEVVTSQPLPPGISACVTKSAHSSAITDRQLSQYQIMFLDIDMDERSGMDIARRVRELHLDTIIIFVTNYPEFSMEGYEVRVFRYLLKQELQQKLPLYFRDALAEIPHDKKELRFSVNAEPYRVAYKDILYLESQQRIVVLHTENPLQGGDHFYGKLEDLENELESDGFLRIQKSYLVNMAHIKKLNYDKVVLSNGEELPVSQKRYAQIKIQYLGWKNKQWGSAL